MSNSAIDTVSVLALIAFAILSAWASYRTERRLARRRRELMERRAAWDSYVEQQRRQRIVSHPTELSRDYWGNISITTFPIAWSGERRWIEIPLKTSPRDLN